MSDVPSPDTRTVEEAAAWFARLGATSVSSKTLEDFYAWRRVPANARAYARIEADWDAAGRLRGDPQLRAATAKAARPRNSAPWLTLAPARLWIGGGALAGCAAIAAALWFQSAPEAYSTRVGEQRLVVLADGSKVRLNTNSQVTVRLGGPERRLTLIRGEALFEAAHDPAHPFVVDAGLARVRALGTRFDVRRDPGAVGVVLIQGKVQVRRDDERAWTLVPNQRLRVPATGAAAPERADPEQATAWTAGRIAFHATPLGEAVEEVNRYAVRKVRLAPGVPDGSPVSGVFNTGDTEGFVSAVRALFGLTAHPEDGAIVLDGPARG